MSIILTGDGSQTIESSQFGVTYHSIHGALQETNHVFIEAGLMPILKSKSSINVFEMGLGTGLNLLATFAATLGSESSISYVSVEAFPLDMDTVAQLDYDSCFPVNISETFNQIHSAKWSEPVYLTPDFSFTKHLIELDAFEPASLFDVIYYDAFAPTAQPELWSEEIMRKMFDFLSPGGTLVTYCAQGQFKRNLKSAGFDVEALPGPPRKREMTRAIKPQ